MSRADRQEDARPCGYPVAMEKLGRRIAFLVELTKGSNLMNDFAGGGRNRRLGGHAGRVLGGRHSKMAGDIASGVVHGL